MVQFMRVVPVVGMSALMLRSGTKAMVASPRLPVPWYLRHSRRQDAADDEGCTALHTISG